MECGQRTDRGSGGPAPTAPGDRHPAEEIEALEQVRALITLRSIGIKSSWLFMMEFFPGGTLALPGGRGHPRGRGPQRRCIQAEHVHLGPDPGLRPLGQHPAGEVHVSAPPSIERFFSRGCRSVPFQYSRSASHPQGSLRGPGVIGSKSSSSARIPGAWRCRREAGSFGMSSRTASWEPDPPASALPGSSRRRGSQETRPIFRPAPW